MMLHIESEQQNVMGIAHANKVRMQIGLSG
jgi:hypothetical protein